MIGPLTFSGQHPQNSEHCRALCSADYFHVLNHASTTFQLKIKVAFHIQREQPSLNQQLHHVNHTIISLILTLSRFALFCCHY